MPEIILDDLRIQAEYLQHEWILKEDKRLRKVIFDFKVTSDDYHQVTTKLYENDFTVKIPDENLQFQASISTYSTSITNLYHEGEVGDYHLELIEQTN
ncbi:YkvR family protein [Salinibacillus aidingensis]|uniref:YkvR family protein n=1 Tax=Salinibacillus aidingensis TaxID=237684 RepID=A0ABN1AM21_9BACI